MAYWNEGSNRTRWHEKDEFSDSPLITSYLTNLADYGTTMAALYFLSPCLHGVVGILYGSEGQEYVLPLAITLPIGIAALKTGFDVNLTPHPTKIQT